MSNTNDPLDPVIDAYLHYLEGEGPPPDLAALAPELRDEAGARVRLLEASWGAVMEAPADDPVARRFGFDRAGQEITIDGRRVAQLRKAASIDLDTLLGMVTAAGGDITAGKLFRLEQNSSATVTQPVASAFVAALRTTLAELEGTAAAAADPVRRFLAGPRFADMIDDWAGRFGRQSSDVRSAVSTRLLAAQYRAEDITDDHLAEVVRAILDSLET